MIQRVMAVWGDMMAGKDYDKELMLEFYEHLALDIKRPSSVLFMARRSMSAGRGLGAGDDSTQNINSVNADKLLNQLKLCPGDAALPKLLPGKASPQRERNHAF